MPGVTLNEWAATGTLIEFLVRDAARQNADLVVLPECAWPAYFLGSRGAYLAARAAGMPGPAEFLTRLGRLAGELHIAVCCGYVEEQPDRLYNTATLIGSDGRILGHHRKCFLWAFDHDTFDAGDALTPIHTPFGRVGLLVCADARLPEIPATLATGGAELLLQPTAWVNAGPPDGLWNPQPEFLIPTRASEFGLPIAAASKWGVEGPIEFVGSSLICDAAGRVRARCAARGTQLALAEISPTRPRPTPITPAERASLTRPGGALVAAEAPTCAAVAFSAAGLVAEQIQALSDAAATAFGTPAVLAHVSRSASRDGSEAPPSVVYAFTPAAGAPPTRGPSPWIASLDAEELERFAYVRSLAANGLLLLVSHGVGLNIPLTQTRACENRIYVATVTRDQALLVSPTGRVQYRSELRPDGDGGPPFVIDLNDARCKLATDRTDVFAGRRPDLYRL